MSRMFALCPDCDSTCSTTTLKKYDGTCFNCSRRRRYDGLCQASTGEAKPNKRKEKDNCLQCQQPYSLTTLTKYIFAGKQTGMCKKCFQSYVILYSANDDYLGVRVPDQVVAPPVQVQAPPVQVQAPPVRVQAPVRPTMPESWVDEPLTGPDEKDCVVCMDRGQHTVNSCGHVCMCVTCSRDIMLGENAACPICRKPLEWVMRTFQV